MLIARTPAPRPRWRRLRSAWLEAAAWLATAAVAVAAVVLAIDHQAQRHLAADAERSALGWARHIAQHVPAIDQVFLGQLPTPQAQERLSHMLGTAGLFRFKLFDPAGQLLLLSDAVNARAPAAASKAADSERARAAASAGRNHVALAQGDGQRRPLFYSEAYVPVLHDGRAIGVVEVYIDQTQLAAMTATSFRRAAATASAVLALCFGIGGLLWRRRSRRDQHTREQVHYLAHHDALTGAINHASFGTLLGKACSTPGAGLAVLCFDLDAFSEVNDSHGHGAGDQVLAMAAARVQGLLRSGDLLARLAGDRFAVLQRGVADSAAVRALAQRVVDSLLQPYRLGMGDGQHQSVQVSASVGAAVHGRDGHSADGLLHKAELALLQAKAQGRGRWSFCDAQAEQALLERRSLAKDLRGALAEGALRLHFQPVYGADGSQLLGYEALARWPHPTRGAVPPMSFVSVAEETGQIEALGRWVLNTACREAAAWPGHLSVAVNLSPAQFRRGGAELVQEVRDALLSSGLAAQRLELEITESLLMNHTEDVLATLHTLHGLGVRIAMDDFGTGYSSLAYLWRFPFDKLKIDRAFTQGLGADGKVDVIINSIVTMAHSLAIKVNAEGVETDAQRQALRRHGCDELQGFLLGRPQPPEGLVHKAVAELEALPG